MISVKGYKKICTMKLRSQEGQSAELVPILLFRFFVKLTFAIYASLLFGVDCHDASSFLYMNRPFMFVLYAIFAFENMVLLK